MRKTLFALVVLAAVVLLVPQEIICQTETLGFVRYIPISAKTKLETDTDVRTLKGHTEWVMSVAFSPTGQILASGSADKQVKLWDVQTGTLLRTLTSKYVVFAVAFSPDGKILATGGGSHPTNVGEIILWDTQTWTLTKSLAGHTDKVYSVAFSPDGKTLASGSQDKTVKLWDVQTGASKRTLVGCTDTVSSVAFSPDSKILASSCYLVNRHSLVWRNMQSGGTLYRFRVDNELQDQF